jgi:hypothetical protein
MLESGPMHLATIVGLSFAALIAGCSSGPAPQGAPPPSAGATVAPAPAAKSAPGSSAPSVAAPSGAAVGETAPAAPVVPRTTAAAAPQSAIKPSSPPAKAPAAVSKAAVAPPKKENAPPDVARKAAPTLDLTSLEQRLKDTSAIGVLTKIALKNQVDDLLGQFRAYYQGKLKTTLAELRRPYDLLVMKVLALLQDSDPMLASAIVASREAIWGILADPVKFATI